LLLSLHLAKLPVSNEVMLRCGEPANIEVFRLLIPLVDKHLRSVERWLWRADIGLGDAAPR